MAVRTVDDALAAGGKAVATREESDTYMIARKSTARHVQNSPLTPAFDQDHAGPLHRDPRMREAVADQ